MRTSSALPAAAGASSGAAFSFGGAGAASGSSSIFSFSAAAGSGAAAAPAAAAPAAGSLFGATPVSGTPLFGAAQAPPPKVELPEGGTVQTGEEDERTLFSGAWGSGAGVGRSRRAGMQDRWQRSSTAGRPPPCPLPDPTCCQPAAHHALPGEGALFEFDAVRQWRERGRGEMRLNVGPRCGTAGNGWRAAGRGMPACLPLCQGTSSSRRPGQAPAHALVLGAPARPPCAPQRPGAAGDAPEGEPAPADERKPVGGHACVEDGGRQGAAGGADEMRAACGPRAGATRVQRAMQCSSCSL